MPNSVEVAVSAIVERNGRYLLVRRANPPSKDQWAFPGGRVQAGETVKRAVLRELAEETHLAGKVQGLFDIHDILPNDATGTQFALLVFFVSVADFSPLKADDDAAELGWFSAAETLRLDMPDSMRQAFEVLGEQAALTSS